MTETEQTPEAEQELKPLPENLQGQESRTAAKWGETGDRLLETHAYQEFKKDRRDLNLLTAKMLKAYFEWLVPRLSEQGIDHPWFHQSLVDITVLWLGCVTQRTPDEISEWTYGLLGEEKLYSASHGVNTGLLPEGIDPSYEQRVFGFLPLMSLSKENLGPEQRWISNDRRARLELVAEMAEYVGQFMKEKKVGRVKILDVGGGNGETACLLAQVESLPEGVLVVVREYQQEMIDEGRAKVKKLKKEGKLKAEVVFIQGDAQEPFSSQEEALLAKYEDQKKGTSVESPFSEADMKDLETLLQYRGTPVAGTVSTFTMGAMHFENQPTRVAENIATQMCKDLNEGGLALLLDFANPDLRKEEFLSQTGKAGQTFYRLKPFLGEGLDACYKNWDHRVERLWQKEAPGCLDEARKALEKAGFTPEASWHLRTLSLIPIPHLPFDEETEQVIKDGKQILCLPMPGYAEMTLRVKK